jgi:hypothetical protein
VYSLILCLSAVFILLRFVFREKPHQNCFLGAPNFMFSEEEDRMLMRAVSVACISGQSGTAFVFPVSAAYFGWREREGSPVLPNRSPLATFARYLQLFDSFLDDLVREGCKQKFCCLFFVIKGKRCGR